MHPQPKTQIASAAGRTLRLLVVDDEPLVSDCIRLMLSFDGHQVQVANSANAALVLFKQGKFDLVFMDYAMPGTKGDELAAAIKAIEPNQPVIMITGNAPTHESMAGVDLIISKPVMLEDLREGINRRLAGSPDSQHQSS